MPIRAENRALYPSDWPAISRRIRFERAQGRCECTGECGGPDGHLADDGRCRNRQGEHRWGGAPGQCVVRLTTMHLDHDPANCADSNLLAGCETCHLRYDRDHHRATRERNRVEALGMDPLFEVPALGGAA